jgi:hypothetical protein
MVLKIHKKKFQLLSDVLIYEDQDHTQEEIVKYNQHCSSFCVTYFDVHANYKVNVS